MSSQIIHHYYYQYIGLCERVEAGEGRMAHSNGGNGTVWMMCLIQFHCINEPLLWFKVTPASDGVNTIVLVCFRTHSSSKLERMVSNAGWMTHSFVTPLFREFINESLSSSCCPFSLHSRSPLEWRSLIILCWIWLEALLCFPWLDPSLSVCVAPLGGRVWLCLVYMSTLRAVRERQFCCQGHVTVCL
jgi:hypothetical protein